MYKFNSISIFIIILVAGKPRQHWDNRWRTKLLWRLRHFRIFNQIFECTSFSFEGGPIFRVSEKNETIIEGVYSYMLWGTCRGRKEPSYVMEVGSENFVEGKLMYWWLFFSCHTSMIGFFKIFQKAIFV